MAKKIYPDDDGRTIVNMNVEGLPWYRPNSHPHDDSHAGAEKNTWRESLRDAFSVALAGILVVACAALPILGFIAFCTNVWLK